MKNTGKCTKCLSGDVARAEGIVGAYGVGNNILTGATIFSAVTVTRFICLTCGFCEEWVESKEGLEKIRKNYK